MSGARVLIAVAVFWLVVGAVYVGASVRQKNRLNLSAAAGGQYPYLACAKRMSEEGVANYLGDRNRMPLYPALLTLIHHDDWDTFVKRSAWFAIASSMIVLLGIGGIAYRLLLPWPASALTLAAVFCVYLDKASFVQAELLYHGLLFGSWLLLCDLIRRPALWRAVLGGALLALTFLTKASALPVLPAFVTVMGVLAVVSAVRARYQGDTHDAAGPQSPRPALILAAAASVLLSFLAVAYPYISDNKARFGRYFYNVNSTFFMWCDRWAEAKAFAEEHDISERYPAIRPGEMPGPVHYWNTHTAGQILRRFASGLRTLWSLALDGFYFKYLAVVAAFCVVLGAMRFRRINELRIEDWGSLVFCVLLFGGYLLIYAWYAQIAYGDRFIRSLFLPAMFAALWLSAKLSANTRCFSFLGRRLRLSDALAAFLVVLLTGEGVVRAMTTAHKPTPAFVQFYYNESRALQDSGNLREAARGFRGVVRLDPSFAPAHHALGMMALTSGRFDEAVAHLEKVVQLDPLRADGHNSLGSALFQVGRMIEAIDAFQKATRLDPDFASAWYNLGGAYCLLGKFDEAKVALTRLRTLDTELADKLAAIIDE